MSKAYNNSISVRFRRRGHSEATSQPSNRPPKDGSGANDLGLQVQCPISPSGGSVNQNTPTWSVTKNSIESGVGSAQKHHTTHRTMSMCDGSVELKAVPAGTDMEGLAGLTPCLIRARPIQRELACLPSLSPRVKYDRTRMSV
jgi:hypothetical protein